jgi:hypothetical protein
MQHIGTLLAAETEVVHDDGSKARVVPGSAYVLGPGHDASVVGDEPAIGLEFESHAAETSGQGLMTVLPSGVVGRLGSR